MLLAAAACLVALRRRAGKQITLDHHAVAAQKRLAFEVAEDSD